MSKLFVDWLVAPTIPRLEVWLTGCDSDQLPIHVSTQGSTTVIWIQSDFGLIQTEFSIRMNPRSEWFGLILIENSVWINLKSDWLGLIWIENLVSDCFGLSRIGFLPFFVKRVTKSFLDWLGKIRIGSDTDIGMNRNSSDWLGMNFNPILSPGWSKINPT